MNITFSTFTYYPSRNGVALVTKYLAEGLAEKGHCVTVICDSEGTDNYTEIINKVNVVRIDAQKENIKHFWSKRKIRDLYFDCIDQSKPEAVVCVCTQTWTIDWLKNRIKEIKCKKILYTHGFSGLYEYSGDARKGIIFSLKKIKHRIKWNLYYTTLRSTFYQFDYVTHLSVANKSYSYLKSIGFENNVIIGNGVEEFFFDNPVCERDKIANQSVEKTIRYIYVSNYGKGKNQKQLLRSFYEMKTDNTELLMIGTEANQYYRELIELKNELEENEHSLRKVRILTGLSRSEISDLMSDSDVCVIPSLMEACSLALLEAAAKGMPIISYNVGNAHLVPGVVVINEFEELPYVMDALAESPLLRVKAGETARLYAEKNARISTQVEKLEALLLG